MTKIAHIQKNPSLNLASRRCGTGSERGETCSYSIGQSNKELKALPFQGRAKSPPAAEIGRGFFGGGLHDALQGDEIIVDPLTYTVEHLTF